MFTKTREIRIETSTLCNYSCIMCARNTFKRNKEVMDYKFFDSIVGRVKTELPQVKIITLSGFGEFSTDRGWKNKVKRSRELFDIVHVVTNLSLIDFVDIDFLIEYVSDIRISVYGLTDDTYRKVHNPPKKIEYNQIRDKILYFKSQKKKSQKIILNYIETEKNQHQTNQWINYWKQKVDLIEVWQPHNWIDSKKYRKLTADRVNSCGRPFNGPIQVQVDGTINICCFDYNGELVIGDLKTQSFKDIFNSKEMEKIQELHKSGNADYLHLCSICDQRNSSKSKSKNLIYNSRFKPYERVGTTSTEYDRLKELE